VIPLLLSLYSILEVSPEHHVCLVYFVDLVCLVYWVYLVYFVDLVYLVYLVCLVPGASIEFVGSSCAIEREEGAFLDIASLSGLHGGNPLLGKITPGQSAARYRIGKQSGTQACLSQTGT